MVRPDVKLPKAEEVKIFINNHVSSNRLRDELNAFVDYFWADFLKAPAARFHHSNWAGGLAHHTFNVMRWIVKISGQDAPELWDSLVKVALVHDFGKLNCYMVNGKGNVVYNKSAQMGHDFYTLFRLQAYGMKLEEEEFNAILMHHGGWSTAANDKQVDAGRLARFLHAADLIASGEEEEEHGHRG